MDPEAGPRRDREVYHPQEGKQGRPADGEPPPVQPLTARATADVGPLVSRLVNPVDLVRGRSWSWQGAPTQGYWVYRELVQRRQGREGAEIGASE